MKKPQKDHIGKRIKKIRAFNGMTQDELAQAINKTRSMVSHIERTGEANYHTLKEIAKVLRLSVEDLQENDNIDSQNTKVNDPYTNIHTDNELINLLKAENSFLKETITNQWKLLFELSK